VCGSLEEVAEERDFIMVVRLLSISLVGGGVEIDEE